MADGSDTGFSGDEDRRNDLDKLREQQKTLERALKEERSRRRNLEEKLTRRDVLKGGLLATVAAVLGWSSNEFTSPVAVDKNSPSSASTSEPSTGNAYTNLTNKLPATRTLDHVQARSKANAVRQHAGIPSGLAVGVRSRMSPGLADPTSLSAQTSDLVLKSDSDAASAATRGTGTSDNPYLIENLEFCDANQLSWSDTEESYHVQLRNCRFHAHPDTLLAVDVNDDSALTVRSCRLSNSMSSGNLLRCSGGKLVLREVKCTGSRNHACRVKRDSRLEMYDSVVSDENDGWGDVGVIRIAGEPEFVRLRNNEISGCKSLFLGGKEPNEVEIRNNHIRSLDGTAMVDVYSGSIKYNRITGGQGIYSRFGKGLVIEHNHFEDAPEGERLLRLGTGAGSNEEIAIVRNKFEKRTGTGNHNECVYASNVIDVLTMENWSVTCPEDAFEYVKGAAIKLFDNVADRCGSAVVDVFQGHEGPGSDAGFYIDGMYGDANIGASVTDVNDGTIRNVAVRCNSTAVSINQRHAAAGRSPSNITVEDFLPLPEVVDGELVSVKGEVGPNIRVQFVEDNQVKRPFDEPRQTELR